ncbi:11833_t:CDS:2, partial [Racocetra fulgida]
NARNQIIEDPTGAWEDSDDEKVCVSLQSKNILKKLRKDEDEDVISGDQYEKRLRQQFEKLYPTPNWATVPSKRKRQTQDNSDSSDDEPPEVLDIRNESDTNNQLDTAKKLISKKKLEVTKMKHANQQTYSQSVIQSIAFHPNAQVAMTAGLDKTIRLFQIDGKINPKIQSVVLKDLPIYRAAFNPNGTEIIVTGRKKYFYIFNIEAGNINKSNGIYGFRDKSLENFSISPCGKYIVFAGSSGYLVLVSNRTKQWVANMKMNGTVTSVDWSSDSRYLYSVGSDAEVYQWDVKSGEIGPHYFVHYKGWKKTYWVPEERVVKYNDANLARQKQLKDTYTNKKKKSANKERQSTPSQEPLRLMQARTNNFAHNRQKIANRGQQKSSSPEQPESPNSDASSIKQEDEEMLDIKEEHLETDSDVQENQSQPRTKKRKSIDEDEDEEEEFMNRLEIKISLPESLKCRLIDDWENITRNHA